jgi:hypothetical protein
MDTTFCKVPTAWHERFVSEVSLRRTLTEETSLGVKVNKQWGDEVF